MDPKAIFLALCLAMAGSSVQGAASPEGSARELFVEAESAIDSGEAVDVDALVARLDGYPLAPYLVYRDLTARLGEVDADEILAFRDDYGFLPVTGILERRWLHSAGERGDWAGFLRVDRGAGGDELACYRLRARQAEAEIDEGWLDRARALWTVGRSQSEACDPVFSVLYERDALSEQDRWQRIEALVSAGHTGVARAVAKRLTTEQRGWLEHWLRVVADPAARLRDPAFDVADPKGQTILRDGLQRLARRDQDEAMARLSEFRDNEWVTDEAARSMQRYIALRAAYDRDDRALALLDALPLAERDPHVTLWLARVALSAENWQRLRAAILDLPESERSEPQWRYWRAVALARTGDRVTAARMLEQLSLRRHYYGFLAADLLNRPYAMNFVRADRDEEAVAALAERPGLVRARELFLLEHHEEARREWHAALAGADADTWRDAAHLALDWGWYGRTVHAANRAGLHDALELRFPLAFRERMAGVAQRSGIDPALAYALIRKESAFDPGAVSRVGALGLMQLMPATARRVARDLGEPSPSTGDLLSPEPNLRLGHEYLVRMLERFDGSAVAAIAAYNAGPTRAEGWRQENAGTNGSLWVENITYGETRDYVKSVLAFRAVFEWRMNGETTRLMPALELASGDSVLASREAP